MSNVIPINPKQLANNVIQFARRHPSAPPEFALTDLGNAKRLAHQYGTNIRYVQGYGRIYWTGIQWVRDRTSNWESLARQVFRSIYNEAAEEQDPDRRKAIAKHAKQSESWRALNAMLKYAETLQGIAIDMADLDNDPWLLNTIGGIVDLRTGECIPHDPEALLTRVCAADYDPEATCPTWERFVGEVLGGDEELIAFVQRFAGYCLTGDVGEQVIMFCHGLGANGKSTFVETLLSLLGGSDFGYSSAAAPGLLIARHGEQHPTEVADLRGRRLVATTEIGEGKRFDEEQVKKLTGGDTLTARYMREDFFSFQPTHKIIVSANHKPTVRATDLGIWRRLLMVPFNVTFPPEQRDRQLPEKLRNELPGILQWAIRGCLEWQRIGLAPPKRVTDETDAYRASQDVVGRWLADCCRMDRSMWASSSDLFASYTAWAKANGEFEGSAKRLSEALIERGCTPEKLKHTRGLKGVGLLTTRREDDGSN